MAYSITMHYGEFAIVHEDMADTLDAMKDGTYSTAMRFIGAQMSAMMDSGILDGDEERLDEAAAEMIAGMEISTEDGAE